MKKEFLARLISAYTNLHPEKGVDNAVWAEKIAAHLIGEQTERKLVSVYSGQQVLLLRHRCNLEEVWGRLTEESEAPLVVIIPYHGNSCTCGACTGFDQQMTEIGLARVVSTEQVASFVRGRMAGRISAEEWDKYPATACPVASSSFAVTPLAGDLGESIGGSEDLSCSNNWYYWFDLSQVPVGGAVWRINVNRTLYHFLRVSEAEWKVTIADCVAWPENLNSVLAGALWYENFVTKGGGK